MPPGTSEADRCPLARGWGRPTFFGGVAKLAVTGCAAGEDRAGFAFFFDAGLRGVRGRRRFARPRRLEVAMLGYGA